MSEYCSLSSWKTLIKADSTDGLKLIFLSSLLVLLREDPRDGLLPEPEPVLEVVLHHGQLRVYPEDHGGGGGYGRPGRADVLRHAGGRDTRLGKVGQQRREDVPDNQRWLIIGR